MSDLKERAKDLLDELETIQRKYHEIGRVEIELVDHGIATNFVDLGYHESVVGFIELVHRVLAGYVVIDGEKKGEDDLAGIILDKVQGYLSNPDTYPQSANLRTIVTAAWETPQEGVVPEQVDVRSHFMEYDGMHTTVFLGRSEADGSFTHEGVNGEGVITDMVFGKSVAAFVGTRLVKFEEQNGRLASHAKIHVLVECE